MKILILDPQQTLYEGAVSEATLPACDGELTMLDDHEPVFLVLKRGVIRLTPFIKKVGVPEAHGIKPIKIRRGLARMRKNELVILVE